MTGDPVELWRAFAKVNLELRVLGQRPDGYHSIETVLQTVDLCDEIRLWPATEFVFRSSREPSDQTNLVVRAVRAFEARTGIPVRLRLELEKRIPVGAGLGGGSSDAAVTLIGLDRHFRAGIDGQDMLRMLGALGSDVPFFYVGGCAVAVGRGEIVFPIEDGPDRWFVLVFPPIGIMSGEAYSWLTQTTESNKILGFCARFVPALAAVGCGPEVRWNDFEEPLFERFPRLAEVKERLVALGARRAALSGSGSALFGEFETEAGAARAAVGLGQEYRVRVVRSLGRRDYFRRMLTTCGGA